MQVVFCLQRVLRTHGLEQRGITGELAAALGVHRHTAAKLLNGNLNTISMPVLGSLCHWLVNQGVPREELPHGLFRAEPADFWRAVAATGNVNIYIGEYRQVFASETEPMRFWVNRHDAHAASAVTEHLYELKRTEADLQNVRTRCVPFRYEAQLREQRQRFFREDTKEAQRLYQQAIAGKANTASLMIGSAEVNYLTEVMVANLFGCRPFHFDVNRVRVPVHMVFRRQDTQMESCFGSTGPPHGFRGDAEPGIYYMTSGGGWEACHWQWDRNDAGIIVAVENAAANALEIVLFGFCGLATAAMAAQTTSDPRISWPPYCEHAGKRLGIYVCRFDTSGFRPDDPESYRIHKTEIVTVDEVVLKRFLSAGCLEL